MIDLDLFLSSGTVVSSEPGKVLVGWGERKWLQSCEFDCPVKYYFPDFFLTDKSPWFVHENSLEVKIDNLQELVGGEPRNLPNYEWEIQGKELFAEAFQNLQAAFQSGALEKAVPYTFATSEKRLSASERRAMLSNALTYARCHPVYLYGFWDQSEGMLGATPEVLFSVKSKEDATLLETVACAGTCPKEESADFIKDSKQLHEHHLVVEGIVKSLSPFGKISAGNIKVLHLGNLCHLVTPITVSAKGAVCIPEVVHAIHPTPALGAFPKQEGWTWLKNYQKKIDRNRFGAPVGYVRDSGESSAYVAIRNLQWKGDKLSIGAGCGVVPQSRLDEEWSEIQLKIQSIKDILGL